MFSETAQLHAIKLEILQTMQDLMEGNLLLLIEDISPTSNRDLLSHVILPSPRNT
jgi:hypothetical protein